jgi:hypothetical protein
MRIAVVIAMRFATLELLRAAYGRYALGAFNVCNMEQIHGLFRGAAKAQRRSSSSSPRSSETMPARQCWQR